MGERSKLRCGDKLPLSLLSEFLSLISPTEKGNGETKDRLLLRSPGPIIAASNFSGTEVWSYSFLCLRVTRV